jgi:hypothetical protein
MGSTAPSQSIAYMSLYQQLAQQYPVFLKQFVTYLDIPADEKRELTQAVDIVGQQKATIEQQQQAIQVMQKMIQRLNNQDVEHEKQHKVDRAEMQIVKKISKLEAQIGKITNDLEVQQKKKLMDVERKLNNKSDSSDKK